MKTLWLHHESGCGGRFDEEPGCDDFQAGNANLVEFYVSIECYVHWYKTGDYELDWTPPEWILDLFD